MLDYLWLPSLVATIRRGVEPPAMALVHGLTREYGVVYHSVAEILGSVVIPLSAILG